MRKALLDQMAPGRSGGCIHATVLWNRFPSYYFQPMIGPVWNFDTEELYPSVQDAIKAAYRKHGRD